MLVRRFYESEKRRKQEASSINNNCPGLKMDP